MSVCLCAVVVVMVLVMCVFLSMSGVCVGGCVDVCGGDGNDSVCVWWWWWW